MKTSVVCRLKRQRRTPCKSALVVSLSKDQLERLGLRFGVRVRRDCRSGLCIPGASLWWRQLQQGRRAVAAPSGS